MREAGSIWVYATADPLEALLLGGLTATLSQGRLVQFGVTPRVYHAPSSIESARVFSDPALNEITVIKQDRSLRLGQDLVVPAVGVTATIPEGVYTVVFRGDLARIGTAWPASISLSGCVALAEISGSETFVHVETGLGTFVCVERGVSVRQAGQPGVAHVDADRAFVFDDAGSPVVIAPNA